MENRIPKPADLTDAEAESLLRALTSTRHRRRTLVETLLELYRIKNVYSLEKKTCIDTLIKEWVKKKANR